jgi:YfiH family protein
LEGAVLAQNGFSYRSGENGVVYSVCDAFSEAGGCAHCFSTRVGGVSTGCLSSLNLGLERGDRVENLRENYKRLASAAGISSNGFCFTRQVHGDRVRGVAESDKKPVENGRDVPECDGLLTGCENTPLVCVSADCVPVLLYAQSRQDKMKRVCGAVHAGWRGTALQIVNKAVIKMEAEYGVSPEDIVAAIGPSISPCCFLTHEDVPAIMNESLGGLCMDFIRPAKDGRFTVDLKGINAALLTAAGVKRVFVSPDCTCCLSELYYSHRRDGALRGSMAAMIMLNSGGIG